MLQRKAVLAFVLAAAVTPALAHGAPRGEAKATVSGKAVSIDYGRPSLAGRDMLGKAEVGKPWRMGADGPTTLKTDAELTFGTAKVPKGSYVLTATKTSETGWSINVAKSEGETRPRRRHPLVAGKLADERRGVHHRPPRRQGQGRGRAPVGHDVPEGRLHGQVAGRRAPTVR